MAKSPFEAELSALRLLIMQARDNVAGIESSQGRAVRAKELLDSALALADDLLTVKPAAVIGAKGGKATAKRMRKKDPEYYTRIAGMRKKRAGGRPKKNP
jgi:hypothetical protein